jgi:hypothetical protein
MVPVSKVGSDQNKVKKSLYVFNILILNFPRKVKDTLVENILKVVLERFVNDLSSMSLISMER